MLTAQARSCAKVPFSAERLSIRSPTPGPPHRPLLDRAAQDVIEVPGYGLDGPVQRANASQGRDEAGLFTPTPSPEIGERPGHAAPAARLVGARRRSLIYRRRF